MINLDKYLNQDIELNIRSGYDVYGKSITTTSYIKGRLVYAKRQDRGLQAKPLDFDVEVWIYPAQSVNVDDTITADEVVFRVIDVQIFRTRQGQIHHKKLLAQKYV
jgi:hypothetical protein